MGENILLARWLSLAGWVAAKDLSCAPRRGWREEGGGREETPIQQKYYNSIGYDISIRAEPMIISTYEALLPHEKS